MRKSETNSVADSTGEKTGTHGASKEAGGHSRDGLTPVSALSAATPKLAPDAVREALEAAREYIGRENNPKSNRVLNLILAALHRIDLTTLPAILAAPVLPPDGAGEKYDGAVLRATSQRLLAKQFPNSAERFKASHQPRMAAPGERDPSVMPDCRSAETASPRKYGPVEWSKDVLDTVYGRPSATGAAEPVAWSMREVLMLIDEFDPNNSDWSFRKGALKEALGRLASPPVRGDRDIIRDFEDVCEKIAATRPQAAYIAMIDGGQGDLLTELDEVRRRARDILSLPVQSGAGEGEAVAELRRELRVSCEHDHRSWQDIERAMTALLSRGSKNG